MKTAKKRTGHIYQFVNMITGEMYIGSTFQKLSKRASSRKQQYRNWLTGKSQYADNNKLFQNIYDYGFESFRYELLQSVEVNNKQELHKIEGDYIRKYDTFKNGLNGVIAGRCKAEYNKEYGEKYRKVNKEKIRKRDAIYYQRNKEKIKTRQSQYSHNKSKVICFCGRIVSHSWLHRHKKSKVHKEILQYMLK